MIIHFGLLPSSSTPGRIVTLTGDLDFSVSDGVQRLVGDAIAPDTRVVLDVTDVGFADSSGLRLLVWAVREAQERGAHLCIAGTGEWLTTLLSMSGVSSLFETYPSLSAALAGPIAS